MASTRLKTTKDGQKFYEIRVRTGRGKPELTTQWYVPEKWSDSAIDRGLKNAVRDFEQKCKNGEVLTRAEQKAKEAAEKAAQEAAAKAAAEEAAKIKTFKQYGENVFMPAKKITTAENTRAYYQNALNNHLYNEFGEFKLPEITSAQISAYFLKLQESDLAHSTIIGIYVTLKQLLTMAYLDDTIDRNPIDKVKRPRQRKDEQKKEVEAFTSNELKQIINALSDEPLKWQAFTRLLIDTGIRRGEACGLKWDSIDFETNTATIKGNLCYTKEKGIYLDTPKTGKTRDVYFSASTGKLLKQLQEQQKADTKRRTDRLTKEGKPLPFEKVSIPEYVFTEKGYCNPMHPQAPNRYFQKFGEKVGIDIHPHKLRHSFASVTITNGADIASVSEVLGHADKSTTLRMYTHADEESKRRAAGVLLQAIEQA